MLGLFQKIEFMGKIEKKKKELGGTAKDKRETSCIKCSLCCWHRPCEFDKEDVRKIAESLGLTEKRFFKKYLCVDQYQEGQDFVLLPIRKSQKDLAGKFVPIRRTYDVDTPCIFLSRKKCKVFEFQPYGARLCACWKQTEEGENKPFFWTKEELFDLGWSGIVWEAY